jgi:hypothetical protein
MDRPQTWSVSWYVKAIYHISNEYLKARTKKVRKTENSWYFSKSKGHNFLKNQWIDTKLKLDQYLDMSKQYTIYQMNIWKHEQKKCGKLRICDIFLSPRAITSWKINGSTPNSNLICILVWQSNVPNIKWISESMNKKSAGKLIYWTDGQMDRRMECKPKVSFDFVGRGLISLYVMF